MSIALFLLPGAGAAADATAPAYTLEDWSALEAGFFRQADREACASRGASGTWTVRREGDRVLARPRQRRRSDPSTVPIPGTAEFSGRRAVLERADGVWLGIDRTEFGGGLWWFPRSGAPPERVSHENVQGIALVDGRVTALTGLAFMTWDQGALLQPERANGSWRLARIVPLGAAPRAHWLEPAGREPGAGGRLFILTGRSVDVFDGRELTRLHTGRYRALDPGSIARDARGRIFIGMRHVVARLSPARRGFHEDWLVPPWCGDVEPGTCGCLPAN